MSWYRWKSKYSNAKLKELLELYYGNVTLADLVKNGFIPSYDLKKGSVVLFDTILPREVKVKISFYEI